MGQTGRLLKTRIAEHRNHIRRNTTTQSVITEHRLSQNHDFEWESVQILENVFEEAFNFGNVTYLTTKQ